MHVFIQVVPCIPPGDAKPITWSDNVRRASTLTFGNQLSICIVAALLAWIAIDRRAASHTPCRSWMAARGRRRILPHIRIRIDRVTIVNCDLTWTVWQIIEPAGIALCTAPALAKTFRVNNPPGRNRRIVANVYIPDQSPAFAMTGVISARIRNRHDGARRDIYCSCIIYQERHRIATRVRNQGVDNSLPFRDSGPAHQH